MGNNLLTGVTTPTQPQILATTAMSLENRAVPGSFMAEVMRDNILLTVAYMRGIVPPVSEAGRSGTPIDWDTVRKPFTYQFELKPGETYTFQKDSLPEYRSSVVKTITVNFAGQDGFKSDGYLMGDGVCHLASLLYKAALLAGIEAKAPTNHNFMPIPEIEREYGVAIYSMPGAPEANAQQNLYIRNNEANPIIFEISYDGEDLQVKIVSVHTPESIAEVLI